MLPIHLFRQNKDLVLQGLAKKNFKETDLVEKIIAADEARRSLQVEHDNLAASVNAASKLIGQHMAKGEKEQAEQLKAQVAEHKEAIRNLAQKVADMEKEQHDD